MSTCVHSNDQSEQLTDDFKNGEPIDMTAQLWRASRRPIRALMLAAVVCAWPASAALAQPAPPSPVPQPADFGAVRAKFENLTPAQVQAAGYVLPAPECVSSPLGGMGFHAINFRLYEQQFASGRMDPLNPPILLIGGNGRVIGLEWEADQRTSPPNLFGQTVRVLPGHPGQEEPHYMLHAYFRPNGQVLFADFDPLVSCPPPGTLPTGFQLAQMGPGGPPIQLPRTGSPLSPIGGVSVLPLVGLGGFLGAAVLLARRLRRGPA